MSGAPFKKLPASPSVSGSSVPVADRGGEEVNVGFSDFGAGSDNQLRDPRARRRAGNDRKFSHGNEFHIMTPAAYHRIAERGMVSRRFVELASRFLECAMFPLMLSITV